MPANPRSLFVGVLLGTLFLSGCVHHRHCVDSNVAGLPRELDKTVLPTYVIEPPDILLIDAVRLIPKPPYLVEPLDSLFVHVTGTLQNEPIQGVYAVEPDGSVKLGFAYGAVAVAGLSVDQAKKAVETHIRRTLPNAQAYVSLAQSGGLQQIQGEHLVRPDGTVGLGTYGSVNVAGMTLDEAKAAIETHLSAKLLNPQVSLDVFAYNSKVYYVITDGGGFGEQVIRIPSSGNETVLDAISQINGLSAVSSKHRVYLVRPAAVGECDQVLPVDWKAITRGGRTATNYQVLPGDRICIDANPLVTTDTFLARVISPVERMFGITLLGTTTIQTIKNGGTSGIGGF